MKTTRRNCIKTDLSGVPAHAEALGELLALRETYDAGREVCPMAQADLDRWK